MGEVTVKAALSSQANFSEIQPIGNICPRSIPRGGVPITPTEQVTLPRTQDNFSSPGRATAEATYVLIMKSRGTDIRSLSNPLIQLPSQ